MTKTLDISKVPTLTMIRGNTALARLRATERTPVIVPVAEPEPRVISGFSKPEEITTEIELEDAAIYAGVNMRAAIGAANRRDIHVHESERDTLLKLVSVAERDARDLRLAAGRLCGVKVPAPKPHEPQDIASYCEKMLKGMHPGAAPDCDASEAIEAAMHLLIQTIWFVKDYGDTSCDEQAIKNLGHIEESLVPALREALGIEAPKAKRSRRKVASG